LGDKSSKLFEEKIGALETYERLAAFAQIELTALYRLVP
jgi:hypothetical protein